MPKNNPMAYRRGGAYEGQGPKDDPYYEKMMPQAKAKKRRNPATPPRNEAAATAPGATPSPRPKSSLGGYRAGRY